MTSVFDSVCFIVSHWICQLANCEIISLLRETFNELINLHNGPFSTECSSRRCDIIVEVSTQIHEVAVYSNKSKRMDNLEINIKHAIANIRFQLLDELAKIYTSTLRFIRDTHGAYMSKIISKHLCHILIFNEVNIMAIRITSCILLVLNLFT